MVELIEDGKQQANRCDDRKTRGHGAKGIRPIPMSPLLREGAMEQGGEASVLADVGKAVNADTGPRRGKEIQWIRAGGEVRDAGHPDENRSPVSHQA